MTFTPAPLAIRFFLDAFKQDGFSRSYSVIDKIMASLFFICEFIFSSSKFLATLLIPGIIFIIFCIDPILETWPNCANKSLNVKTPCFIRSAVFFWTSISNLSWACSTKVTMSPIPKIRSAIRSGWNSSKSSTFSPLDTNNTGTFVIDRTDNNPPPRASPSIFVTIKPVTDNCSLNSFATVTMSWPVIASTVNRISSGTTSSFICCSSCINASSICKRPAVSKITKSFWRSFAYVNACLAVSTADVSGPHVNTSTSILFPRVCNCSIAAGRTTSHATNKTRRANLFLQ